MSETKKTFEYGKHTVSLQTGNIARQTSGAVLIDMEGTVVLVTVVGLQEDDPQGRDFFPLTVNYQERTYAAGSIPGGYFRREGRPTEKETLTSRLIDRPIRPLFPKGFKNEVQVVATVMSLNPEVNPDIPALLGASAALAISGLPFQGPLGAARVAYVNEQFILNPTYTELAESKLDLVVAGTADAAIMIESEAKELPESVMLDAVEFGHQQMQVAINAINELAAICGKPRWEWQPPAEDTGLFEKVSDFIRDELLSAYQIREKLQRKSAINVLCDKVLDEFCPIDQEPEEDPVAVEKAFEKLEKKLVRAQILQHSPRIDGRDSKTIRPISVDTSILPRTHGSALFTRGETQAIVVATLGTAREAQTIDALQGEQKETFMLHYNFPPYSVGETGMMGSPKRREIGHGRLARRAMEAVIPDQESFPYVLRVVSEITESNGSSSMASVCGTSLALMDAGVPIKAPVAGIAMGLVKEGEDYVVLSDILGDEDHLGDMDFKVAGTSTGVTALQMDIKITGITKAIMADALEQAREGRLHILDVMSHALSQPRPEMSAYAPRIINMNIDPEKIRDVIGKGGATIRGIIEETGVSIDINDDGLVNIASNDEDAANEAIRQIELLTAEVEVGKIYNGKVIRIVDFGAFVNILPGKDGLVHVSQITEERVNDVNDYLQVGAEVPVKVLEIDRQGRIRLSMKEVNQDQATVAE